MSTTQSIAVFVVDDTPSMRERLRELLEDIDGVEVIGEAGNLGDATAGILRTHPDCVLLDYQIEGGTGVDVLRAVRLQSPQIEFIVLTNHATDQHRRACLDAGARFFFDKSSEFGSIRTAIAEIDSRRALAQPRRTTA
jgi:DNA-binding NarL/FixJ family response regulator